MSRLQLLIDHAARHEDEIRTQLVAAQESVTAARAAIDAIEARGAAPAVGVSPRLNDQYLRFRQVLAGEHAEAQRRHAEAIATAEKWREELLSAHRRRRSFEHLAEREQREQAKRARRREAAANDELALRRWQGGAA